MAVFLSNCGRALLSHASLCAWHNAVTIQIQHFLYVIALLWFEYNTNVVWQSAARIQIQIVYKTEPLFWFDDQITGTTATRSRSLAKPLHCYQSFFSWLDQAVRGRPRLAKGGQASLARRTGLRRTGPRTLMCWFLWWLSVIAIKSIVQYKRLFVFNYSV